MRRRLVSPAFAVVCLLLAAGCLLAIFLQQRQKEAQILEIYQQNKPVAVLALSQDTEYSLPEVGMKIIVRNRAAYISESSCPCKTCQRFGKLSRAGQTAVCLPSRICLIVKGNSDVDAVLCAGAGERK